MSSFNGQNLFASGPHRFVVHGLTLRHATHESPGADGARVTALGRSARRIDQHGTLTADDIAAMQQRLDAIEYLMQHEFELASHQDLTILLRDPVDATGPREVEGLPGVGVTEAQLIVP